MSPEAVDLIDKLMQLNPLKRLGAGTAEEGCDFAALKQHQFFKIPNYFDRVRDGYIAPPKPSKDISDPEPDLKLETQASSTQSDAKRSSKKKGFSFVLEGLVAKQKKKQVFGA